MCVPEHAPSMTELRQTADGSYTPRNILVTGGAGFIGSHVVRYLLRHHPTYRVVVLDKLDYCASLLNLEDLEGNPSFKFIKGDILSGDLLIYVLATENIDTVLHFAAQTHVDNSFGNSLAFTMNNICGTHVLLEAARTYGLVRRLINVSTDEVYGETSVGLARGLPESSPMAPTNPYAAAKAGAELMALAYHVSYGLPIIVTRGNNVYGPGQFPEKLVPKFLMLAQRGEALPIYGDGLARRSYLYVEDVAEAYAVLLHRGRLGEVYNIGSQTERSVLDVAADVLRIAGRKGEEVVHVRDRTFNDRRYYINDRKLADLGWSERTGWDAGLEKTRRWYSEHGCTHWDANAVRLALMAHPTSPPASPVLRLDAFSAFLAT